MERDATAADAPVLHYFGSCPRSSSVRAVLQLKRVEYRGIAAPIIGRLTLLRLSGQRWPPVLVHRGRVVVHTQAILRYLDKTFPQSPIFPTDPRLLSDCLSLSQQIDDVMYLPCLALKYLNPQNRSSALDSVLASYPSGYNRLLAYLVPMGQRLRLRYLGFDMRSLTELRERLADWCEGFDARLNHHPYLISDNLTCADVRLYTGIRAMAGCVEEPEIGRYANLAAWLDRLETEHSWLRVSAV